MRRTLVLLPLIALGCGAPPEIAAPPTLSPPTSTTGEEPPVKPAPWTAPPLVGSSVLEDMNPDPNIVEVYLVAYPADIELQSGRAIEMFTFNGEFPGPALQAKKGDRVIVHFDNQLSEPTTIHWHGLRISDQMDGNPRIQDPVQPGQVFDYDFVVPEAGSFWYHPHVRSNEQIEKGLYGPIVVHDVDLDPMYNAERYIMLDDILLTDNGLPPFLASHPEVMHGRFGNVLLTNGRGEEATVVAKKGSVERWRLVNTANARTMEVEISGARFRVIGTDGGLIREPYSLSRLEIGVGNRYDLEVTLNGDGPVTLNQVVVGRNDQGQIEEFSVPVVNVQISGVVDAPLQVDFPRLPPRMERPMTREVEIELGGRNGPQGIEWTLNDNAHGDAPIFTFSRGDVVKMKLVNILAQEHPFHLHGQFFEVLDNGFPSTLQPGLKDSVLVHGGETIEIMAYFDNPGRWMAHCHILEHAELGMMSEIVVD